MSMREMGHRVTCLAHSWLQAQGCLTVPDPPEPEHGMKAVGFIHAVHGRKSDLVLEAADSILRGELRIFAQQVRFNGIGPSWNSDPSTLKAAPLTFGKHLNYRNADLVGDIKYLWEPNRHLHLVTLAQAYALSGERRYLDGLGFQLRSWLDQCPYLLGPNWASSLELGIRLVNWSLAWQLIGGAGSPLFEGGGRDLLERWLRSVYQHVHFVRGHFSRYSSANNHLIGEAAGVFVATVTWPHWSVFERWRGEAAAILEEEVLRQNGADGVNREQAVSYQQFVLDFLIIAALAGRSRGIELSISYWRRLEAMLEYLASLMDVAGNVPMIGDADDGFVVKLSAAEDFCPYRSLLCTGAVLFQRPDFMSKAGSVDEKTLWLLGAQAGGFAPQQGQRSNARLPVRRSFPEGGYHILGKDFETGQEVKCVVDCGPLGYLSIAAHGHADALSLYLSVGGREFLIDPGTYAYHTRPRWRDYFRGTSAHNTVRVDGENQSVIAGNFMWSHKAAAWCEAFTSDASEDRFVGCHDGYLRLPDPVLHRREIRFLKAEGLIVVTDRIECSGEHLVERFWHFSERCSVKVDGRAVLAAHGGKGLSVEDPEGQGTVHVFRGDDQLPLGWVSRRFDSKEPASTAVWRGRVTGTTVLRTVISIRHTL